MIILSYIREGREFLSGLIRKKDVKCRSRAMKFRLYPDASQRDLFARTFGCCRFLYNRMLEERIRSYGETGRSSCRTPAAYKKEYPWLKEVDSQALAHVYVNLDIAFKNFFAEGNSGFPKFKSKHRSRKSYTSSVVNNNIRIEGNRLKLPKAGYVKIRLHREIPAEWKLKSAAVSLEPTGEYYAALLYDMPACDSQTCGNALTGREDEILGIDFAMHGLAVFSDGSRAEYPMYYRKAERRLAGEQRKLSRCRKGSRNYAKQRRKLARCHAKVRNQRKDFHHKLSHTVAERYGAVAVEDLNMKAMSRGLRLGKSTMDNGYGMFLRFLEYKLRDRGKELVRVGRFFPSSKMCSRCGGIKHELPLSMRTYDCACGNHMDRDVNAAVNIREEGRRLLAAS